MTRTSRIAMAASMLLIGAAAAAHHSVSNFAADREMTITGKVTYVSFTNPHSYFDVDVVGEAGETRQWKIFATSRVVLQRYGWTRDSVQPGHTITVTGRPDKTKPREMYLTRIVFADGSEWLRSSIDN